MPIALPSDHTTVYPFFHKPILKQDSLNQLRLVAYRGKNEGAEIEIVSSGTDI